MTFYSEISDNGTYIVHVAIGDVTLEEATESYKRALENRNFTPGMDSIWDLTSGSFEKLNHDLFKTMIQEVAKTNHMRGEGHKVAVVVGDMTEFELGQQYEEMTHGILPHNMRVFMNMTEALGWLKGEEPPRT